MHINIFQDFNYRYHWELISSTGSKIDGSTLGVGTKVRAIEHSKNTTAAHGLINIRIVEETELRAVKIQYEPLPETITPQRFAALRWPPKEKLIINRELSGGYCKTAVSRWPSSQHK